MKTDIEIAQAAPLKPIWEIAEAAGLRREELILYGDHKAKVELALVRGKRQFDKREAIAKRQAQRDVERALKDTRQN